IYIDKKDLDKADKIADDLQKRFPKQPEGSLLKGIVLYYRKNYSEAIAALYKSIEIRPTVGCLYFLGLSQYNKGDYEQALSQFQKMVDIKPSYVQPRLFITMIHLRQKRFDNAIQEA